MAPDQRTLYLRLLVILPCASTARLGIRVSLGPRICATLGCYTERVTASHRMACLVRDTEMSRCFDFLSASLSRRTPFGRGRIADCRFLQICRHTINQVLPRFSGFVRPLYVTAFDF